MTPENAKLIYGFSVPKVSALEDMVEIDKYLTEKEKQFKIEPYTYKVIPWLETSKAITNANEIMKKYRHRIEAAAFGGRCSIHNNAD